MASSEYSHERNLMPVVYIDKVTLENNSAPSPPSDNPHIVDTEKDVLRSQQIGISAEMNFLQTSLAEAQTQGGCEITIDMILKDNIENTALSSWFYNANLLKYMHLKVVQSTNKNVTQNLIKGQFTVLEEAEASPYVEVQVVDLANYYESTKDFYTVAEDGRGKVADIPYQTKFFLSNERPQHLAYFAYCFFDVQQLVQDHSLDMYGYSMSQGVMSKYITSEVVIDGGSVISSSYVFYLPSGKLWTGPVHRHNGVWMAGANHTSDPHPILTRQVVINSTVQDFRDLEAIAAPEVNLDPLNQITTILRDLNIMGSDPVDNKESAFFSDAYIMRNNLASDSVGGTSMLFSFDVSEFMRQKSVWGSWLYSGNSTTMAPKILSLKVYRHRAKTTISQDRLGSPVRGGNLKLNSYIGSEEAPVLVIDSRADAGGTLVTKRTDAGSIREVHLEGTEVRNFMVTDYSLDKVTDGLYQYSVEIQVQDHGFRYLSDILTNLQKAIGRFQIYYGLSTTPDYYDSRTNQLKSGLLNHYGSLGLSGQESMPWVEGPARLMEVIETMLMASDTTFSSEIFSNMLTYFMSLCNPQTGTPKGIYAVLKAMEITQTSMERLVGKRSNRNERSGGFGSSQNTILTDTQTFTGLVNSEVPDNYGQRFLGLTNRNGFAGPPVYTVQDYVGRVEQENNKYFSIESSGASLPSDVNEVMGDASTALLPNELRDLSTYGATYLSPIGAINGTNTLNSSDNLMQNIEKYRKFSLPLLMAWLKSPSNTATMSVDLTTTIDMEIKPGGSSSKVVQPTVTISNATPASITYLSNMGISLAAMATVKSEIAWAKGGTLLRNVGTQFAIGGIPDVVYATNMGSVAGLVNSEDLSPSFVEFSENGTAANIELEMQHPTLADELASTFASDLDLMQDTNREAMASFVAGSPIGQLEIGSFSPVDADGLIEGASAEYLSKLPNQIKSLFMSGDPSIVRYPWLTADFDVLRNPETALMFIWNYQNIAKIEYLTYSDGESGPQVASPVWKPVTFNTLATLSMSQGGTLCRLVPYYDTKFKIGMSKYAQMPYYENYFILTSDPTNLGVSPAMLQGTQSATNFVQSALTLWQNFADIPSSGYMTTVPGAGTPQNSSGDVEAPYSDPFPSSEGEVIMSLADAIYDEVSNVCSAAIVEADAPSTSSTPEASTEGDETGETPTIDMGSAGGTEGGGGTGSGGGTTYTEGPNETAVEDYGVGGDEAANVSIITTVTVEPEEEEPEEQEDTYDYDPNQTEGLPNDDYKSSSDNNYGESIDDAIDEYVNEQQKVEVTDSKITITKDELNSLIERSVKDTVKVGGQSYDEMLVNQTHSDQQNNMGGNGNSQPTQGNGSGNGGVSTPSIGGGY